jgi:hypothetical protein
MRDVVGRDAKHNPNALRPPEAAQAPKVVTAGEEPQNRLPPGQDLIRQIADHFAPHGPGNKEARKK